MTAGFLFTNNPTSKLASGISNVATSVTLTTGSGALFPNPGANQQFALTFTDALTGLLNEIVYCTARTGDVLTIVRAQEGTSALAWAANDIAAALVTAGNLQQFVQNQSSLIRQRLVANTTFYVSTSGSNSTGNGTSGSPWALPSFALNYIKANIDLNGFSATVQCADGSYTDSVVIRGQFVGGSAVTLTGNASNNAAVSINDTTASGGAITVEFGVLTVSNLKVTSINLDGIGSLFGSTISINNVNFGSCPNGSHMHAVDVSTITGNTNYNISGGAQSHIACVQGGIVEIDGAGVTLTGTPSFNGGFVNVRQVSCLSAGSVTFTGSATGVRYTGVANSVIDTNSGGNVNYFPGNSAGSVSTGAIYL